MEHRCSPRFPTDVRAELITKDERVGVARIRNASTLGYFLSGVSSGLRLHQQVTLKFSLEADFKVSGRIVRIEENGFAVELETMASKEYYDARKFVEAIKTSAEAKPASASKLVNQ
ncbi:PilZ domain-containing protein [Gilvimarinus sp. SDUM040013]|uniref:PilZ domain-containing protein n=1 Tax=Gilvimarinus gilvus TaxID=3058038 RepID=A0ABU4S255_9GAMM|nr:PilZ domain-containing protein [Gilvimarinus sp. SDUM040013]MDO3385599.1 PilZ domain-containing protein [Gilvimarinus sp. SDUM040013]MDX6849933.1 PilZ domain-containing protein [Gilvimarinus sp. SDUM040013]